MKARLLLLLILCAGISQAQQKNRQDSLLNRIKSPVEDTNKVNSLNALAWELRLSNLDQALIYGRQALKISEKLHWKDGMGHSYYCLSFVLRLQGNFVEAIEYGQQAYAMYLQTNNTRGLARTLSNNGNTYYGLSDYPKALESQLKCLRIREQQGNKSNIATSLNNIGVIYEKLKDYPKALAYYIRCLKMFEAAGNKGGISAALGNIGLIYLDYKNYPKALEYQLRSRELAKELKDLDSEAQTYSTVGNVYFSMGKPALAIENMKHAIEIYQELGNKKGIGLCYSNMGVVEAERGNHKAAIEWMLAAKKIGREIGAMDMERDALGQLANVYKTLKQADKALEATEAYIVLRDSIMNREKNDDIVRQEMNFEYHKKEAALKAEQERKDAVAKEELKQQRQQRNYFITGFCLTLLLAFFIFNGYRQKQKANVEITHQKKLIEEKSKEVHDSIVYAQRIQNAILPSEALVKKLLPQSFILYKPKDIVSGDFYWLEKVGNKLLFAAVDCTGHGVPGAMVSVVGYNALNRTVREFGLTNPARILDKLTQLVEETFATNESDVKDGMDISLCSLDMSTLVLEWAGANNPLWILNAGSQEGEQSPARRLKEIKGDKQPIGKFENRRPFTGHSIQLSRGDSIYIFTDGFADQFGGPHGKKLKYTQIKALIIDSIGYTMEEQKKRYEKEYETWKGSLEQVDDVCIIGVTV